MKLLFDQNISHRLTRLIEDIFPDSKQVLHLGLQDVSDFQIFEFAKVNGFAIVTFDADFVDLSIVKGFPPKIIWIRTGNLTTSALSTLILHHQNTIKNFLALEEEGILEIIKFS